jgi:hypothetical protein
MTNGLVETFLAGWLGKLLVGSVAVMTSLRYGTGIYAWRETEKLERPVYLVIQKLSDGVELRRYEPYLIAETTVDGVGFSAGKGFGACAGYIFGKNKPRRGGDSEKMAMTAPVRISGGAPSGTSGEKMAMTAPVRVNGGSKKTKVSFVMGRQYSLKTLPNPLDKNVKLRQVPAHTLAVRNFSGPPPKDERVQREKKRIENALREADIKSTRRGELLVYGYHDPFITPNFLRRNEVAVVVEGNP